MVKVLKLAIILALFCVLSAWGLAYVYTFTQPKIEQNLTLTMENSKREVSGEAFSVSTRGYSGPIDLLVGVGSKGKVTGVKILSQRETPGLGANIAKPGFLKQFIGKSLSDSIEPKKDIDAITGASISSRAVCTGVKQALQQAREKP